MLVFCFVSLLLLCCFCVFLLLLFLGGVGGVLFMLCVAFGCALVTHVSTRYGVNECVIRPEVTLCG